METFNLILLVFTVLVGAFIVKTLFFVVEFVRNEMLGKAWGTGRVVNIVEKAYRGRDYRTSIRYSMMDDVNKCLHHGQSPFSGQPILTNEDHKKYMIRQLINDLSEKIYEDGVVEIEDNNRNYSLPPWEREINLRLKVYVPE